MMKRSGAFILLGLSMMAHGSEESFWGAEVELGAVFTSGNTNEKNVKFRGEVVYDGDRYKHAVHLDALNSSKDKVRTAQKTYLFYQVDYKLEKGSVFGRVAHEEDKFSGFDYQTDITGGYSRLLMEKSTMSLTGDIGLGYRRSELENGESEDEGIVRLAAKYVWQLSENATFEQSLSTEIGNESTISRSETSLSANIAGNLAMKLAVNIKNNSDVPAGNGKNRYRVFCHAGLQILGLNFQDKKNMKIIAAIEQYQNEMTSWRRDIHSHPEIAFDEHRTAKIVAEKLESFGIEVETGIAGTGVVGTLKKGRGNRAIGLRADLDALPIHEANDFEHKSQYDGLMHACGHDGHTCMLLGAARYLAENDDFEGIVHFIFQPAEENEGGGKAMVEAGLFDKYPVESVFGMHNIPGMPVGTFAIKAGPMMAAFDIFGVKIFGRGGHAAMPQFTIDPIVIGTKIVEAYQSIISRFTDPQEPAVLSVTQFHAGDAYNVIPNDMEISGCTRCFSPKIQDRLEKQMQHMATEICSAYGATCEFFYERRYPPTINSELETQIAGRVASDIVGADHVNLQPKPAMGSEDFAFMLMEKPGSYIWIGNGDGEGSCMVHNPSYDFNDEILSLGATYWVRMVEHILPPIKL